MPRDTRTIYVYNPETCAYEPERKNRRYYLRKYAGYVLLSLPLAAGLVVLFFAVYDSPQTRALRQQNENLLLTRNTNASRITEYQTQLDSLKEKEKAIYRTALNEEPQTEAEPTLDSAAIPATVAREHVHALETRVLVLQERVRKDNFTAAAVQTVAVRRNEIFRYVPSIRPVRGKILSGHGLRKHPLTKEERQHNGIDFEAAIGTPVVATADGRVISVDRGKSGDGLSVTLDHNGRYRTHYSHLDEVQVQPGQEVRRGEIIASSGNSGLCKGPHLHYQLFRNGKPLDPIHFFFADITPDEFVAFRHQAGKRNESMN